MRDRCLWERVFLVNEDEAVRPEEVVEPRVVAMAVVYYDENDVIARENDGKVENPPRRSVPCCHE